MQKSSKHSALRDLRIVPGVGKRISEDLWNLGIRSVQDLKGKNPQDLYERLISLTGAHVDRCMPYVFRCAVYYASTEVHDPDLLKWWKWKDKP
jgi:hypothetical protein